MNLRKKFKRKNQQGNSQEIEVPDEILLHIFSFFKKPEPAILTVSKQWNRIANSNDLWRTYIKASFHARLDESGNFAKEFYKSNVPARINANKIYCLPLPVKCKRNGKKEAWFVNFLSNEGPI